MLSLVARFFYCISVCSLYALNLVSVVVDISASARLGGEHRNIILFVEDFISSLPENVHFELLTFGDQVTVISPAKNATQENKHAVKGLLFLAGDSLRDDSLKILLEHLMVSKSRVVIFFTDGLYSDVNPVVQFDLSTSLRNIREQGTTIIPVSVGSQADLVLLEKLAVVTKGSVFRFENFEKLKRDLITVTLSLINPNLNLNLFQEINTTHKDFPGLVLIKDQCVGIELLDPDFRYYKQEDLGDFFYKGDSLCVLMLSKPGTWRIKSSGQIVPLTALRLQSNIPSKLAVGQVVDLKVFLDNLGHKVGYVDLLRLAKVRVQVYDRKIMGDPIFNSNLELDFTKFEYSGELFLREEGDYKITVQILFPFLSHSIDRDISVRGKLLEVVISELAQKMLPELAGTIHHKAILLKTMAGTRLENLLVTGESKVNLLEKNTAVIEFLGHIPDVLELEGNLVSGKEKIRFRHIVPIEQGFFIHPRPSSQKVAILPIIIGVALSILANLATGLWVLRKLNTNDINFDESLQSAINDLWDAVENIKFRTAEDLIESCRLQRTSELENG
ncbi:MAG: VWA domain-containing protein [Deltaproteobacteria bacterium]|nr:VWA domain-containing protein [Deltaproteobacteria bacterium]